MTATSSEHDIYDPVSQLELFPVANMPLTINRGQEGVVPLTLTFTNPTGANGSGALLQSLQICLRDDTGSGVVPADLLTRVTLVEGGDIYIEKTTLETTGNQIYLTLSRPVRVSTIEPVTLGLQLDISPTTTTTAFLVEITSADWFNAVDEVSGAPVSVALAEGTFPIQSGLGRLLVEATGLQVASASTAPLQAGEGQAAVSLMRLNLLNSGTEGLGSDVKIGSLSVSFTDTFGVPLAVPGDVLDRIRVEGPLQNHLNVTVLQIEGAVMELVLSPLLTVPVDTPVQMEILADIGDPALTGAYRLQLASAEDFLAYDGNSGAEVPVIYGSDPVTGGIMTVQEMATDIMAGGEPAFPTDLVVGAAGIQAMGLTLRHPGGSSMGAIQVDSLIVQCRNENRELMSPTGLLDQLTVLWAAQEVGSLANPSGDGVMAVPLIEIILQPGQTVDLVLQVDIEFSAPAASLELVVTATGVVASDINLGLLVTVQPEEGEEFPLTSGLTRLRVPADELLVAFQDKMPAVLAGDGQLVSVASVIMFNPSADEAAGINVEAITLVASDLNFASRPLGAAVEEIQVFCGQELWAPAVALAPTDTTVTIQPGSPDYLIQGQTLVLEVRITVRQDIQETSLRLGLDQSGVSVIQPDDPLFTVRIEAEQGNSFPFWTEVASFGGGSLADSYSNFPNPFAAGREVTNFTFELPDPGHVSLRLYTAHWDPVTTILAGEWYDAGLHQENIWDGRNGRGMAVQNGIYIAELLVRFNDGTQVRHLRKVAVVR